MSEITFKQLRAANVQRCEEAFHAIDDWSPQDWGNAMAGEYGEVAQDFLELQTLLIRFFQKLQVCDTLKKMLRSATDNEAIMNLKKKLAKEIADVVIYADLLAERVDIDLGEAIVEKFNEVSDRRQSSIKL